MRRPVRQGRAARGARSRRRGGADARRRGRGGSRGSPVIAAAYATPTRSILPRSRPCGCPGWWSATGIAGALVDTFVKDGRGLYGWLSPRELAELIDAHARGRRELRAWPGSCGWVSWAAWTPTWSACARRCVAVATGRRELEPSLVAAAVAELRGQSWRRSHACRVSRRAFSTTSQLWCGTASAGRRPLPRPSARGAGRRRNPGGVTAVSGGAVDRTARQPA